VATFQQALDQAAVWTGADRIYLGAATYTAPSADGFTYTPTAAPVEIVGAGTGQTILKAPAGATKATLTVTGGGADIHDLTINLPASAPFGYAGLVTDAWAENISVTESLPQSQLRYGVVLRDFGSLRSSTVAISTNQTSGYGVKMTSPGTSVWASTVSGPTALEAQYGGTVDDSHLFGYGAGFAAYHGTTELRHSIINFASTTGSGIYASNQPVDNTTVHADGVVINGPGGGSTGVIATNSIAPDYAVDMTMVNSVIRNVWRPLYATAGVGSGHSAITATYSDFDPAADGVKGASGSLTTAHNLNTGTGARFVDGASGDFHLRNASPLIDAGDPSSTPGPGDLDSNPLDTDGNGDGIGRRDIGAYEAPGVPFSGSPQAPASVPAQAPADPAPAEAAVIPASTDTLAPVLSRLAEKRLRLRYTLSESAAVTIKLERALVVGAHKRWHTLRTLTRTGKAGANAVRISRSRLRHGSYRALVRATDAAGNRSALHRLAFPVR
jgi:hypothetical protein